MNKIAKIKAEVNKNAVEVLEAALVRVKSGEITAIGLSWVTSDLGIGCSSSSGPDNFKMWASLEHSAREFYVDNILN